MKKLMKAILLVFSLGLISVSCKKEKTGIDGLPPITQTGENTFGCLVNGVLLIPKGTFSPGPSPLQLSYPYYNFPDRTGNYFNLSAYDSKTKRAIHIIADSVELKPNTIYKLGAPGIKKTFSGLYTFSSLSGDIFIKDYTTAKDMVGELAISRFDEVNHIISGTFWFDAICSTGESVEIREGRFDIGPLK